MILVDVQDKDPYTCTCPYYIKGSICKPFNVLAVRKYVGAYMVLGYTTPSHLKLRILSNMRKCKIYKNAK